MEIVSVVYEFLKINVFGALFPCIIFLWLSQLVVRNKKLSEIAKKVVFILLIVYAGLFILQIIFNIVVQHQPLIPERATGPYAFAYWIALLAGISPLVLLVRYYKENYFLLLIVSFIISITSFFEKFVILITSWHRDFLPGFNIELLLEELMFYLLHGVVLAGIILGFILLKLRLSQWKKL